MQRLLCALALLASPCLANKLENRPAFSAGDRVVFKGGYKRLDENVAVLDPCMANAIVAVASAPMAAIER